MRGFFGKEGFTLIELMIVVAIIAILAAIALSNFLEAQNRFKVSRVLADQRALAIAMEAYAVDNNSYVKRIVGNPNDSPARFWRYITTPIASISSIPEDPFYSKSGGLNRGRSSDDAYKRTQALLLYSSHPGFAERPQGHAT